MTNVAAMADGLLGVAELGDEVGELRSGIGAVLMRGGEVAASDLDGPGKAHADARSRPFAFVNSPKRADSG